jgi:cell division protein FtsB
MVTKKKKNKKSSQSNFKNIIFFVVSFLVFIFLLISNINIAKKRLNLINHLESLKEKIDFLEQQKAMLESRISDAQTGDYWEEIMREQGYVKEGEESIIILSQKEEVIEEKREDNIIQIFVNQLKKLFIFRE